MHVWGECQCGLDKAVTAHTALLPSDIFYVLVLFIFYFYCLLNGFFWLCFVWTSVQRKQFCSEKHFANCPKEERAGASLATIASTILILAVNPKMRISTQSLLMYPFTLWKAEKQKGALICNDSNTGTFRHKTQNSPSKWIGKPICWSKCYTCLSGNKITERLILQKPSLLSLSNLCQWGIHSEMPLKRWTWTPQELPAWVQPSPVLSLAAADGGGTRDMEHMKKPFPLDKLPLSCLSLPAPA